MDWNFIVFLVGEGFGSVFVFDPLTAWTLVDKAFFAVKLSLFSVRQIKEEIKNCTY